MWLRTGSDRSKRTLLYVEILVEASTAADGVIWRERRGFGRCRSAMLGFTKALRYVSNFDLNDFPQFSNPLIL